MNVVKADTAVEAVPEKARPDDAYFIDNKLTQLPKIHCGNSDCTNGLHCFYYYESKRSHPTHDRGACQGCGEELVDWQRVQNCSPELIDEKFAQMKREWVRHYYWHAKFDDNALRLAHFRGRRVLEEMLRGDIRRNVVALNPINDRRSTPYKGDVIHYARHATASCCRVCIEYWHGIPRSEERPLTERELDYLVELGRRYLLDRLPEIKDDSDQSYRKKPQRSRTVAPDARVKSPKERQKNRGRTWEP